MLKQSLGEKTMKFLTIFLMLLFLTTISCSDNNRPYRADSYRQAEYASPAPQVLYSNCYIPGRGFLGDNGYYYPNGYTYRCNGMVYRSGVRYRGSILGALAIGYYFGSFGPGYGHYGRYHSRVTNVTNVTIIKKGSPAYSKRMNRYNKIQKKRNKNKWVSKSEKKRRVAQSKKDKASYKKKRAAKRKASSSATRTRTRTRSRSKIFSRSSSRSSFRSRRRSDLRYKNNVEILENALAKVQAINGVYYFYNNSYKKQVGVIAQDVEKVLPEVVSINKEGFRTVQYDLMVPLLIEAIKEQQIQIESLKSKTIR